MGYKYEDSTWFTTEGDLRWYYTVLDTTFNGTIIVNTKEGSLSPAIGSKIAIADKSIEEEIKRANRQWGGNIFLSIWILFLIGGAVSVIKKT